MMKLATVEKTSVETGKYYDPKILVIKTEAPQVFG
jgi:hypothetical protein